MRPDRLALLDVRKLLCPLLLALTGWTSTLAAQAPTQTADLFKTDTIWNVHLTFTPDQWAAMEPSDPQQGGFPPNGGPGGGPMRFGPANFIVPGFLKAGDQDSDGKLSKTEFAALGEKWFTAWDTAKNGKLTQDQIRDGLGATLFANFGQGGPPGDGPRPGPGGPPGFGTEYPTVHASLDFNGQKFDDVAIRYKGNFTYMASRGQLKRSMKIDLNSFVKGQRLAGVSTLNLHSNVTDPAWMNEVLSYQFFRDAGVPAPRTAYARVFLTVKGKYDHQYIGLYTLVENIGKNFAEERFGSKKGALFKPETRDIFNDLGDDWSRYEKSYGAKEDLSDAQQNRVVEFSKFVSKAPDAEFAAKLGDYLNIDEFARFMAATVWLSNLDSLLSMGHNFYVYLEPKTHRFEFLPWDLDLSFGKFNMGGTGPTETLNIQKPWSGNNRFLERVFAVDSFKQAYLARLAEISATLGKPEHLSKEVDNLATTLRPAVQEESSERLARFDKSVSGQASTSPAPAGEAGLTQGRPLGERRGGPGGPGGPMSDKPIKTFVVAREQSVLAQLQGKQESPAAAINPGPFGPGGFGPGGFLAQSILKAFDTDHDGAISHEEFIAGFAGWFDRWNTGKNGLLTEDELKAGINRDLAPPFPGPPPGNQ